MKHFGHAVSRRSALIGYSLGKSTGVGAAAGEKRVLARDPAGRITGYTHTNNGASVPALNQAFVYDKLGRLTNATLNGASTQCSYDATGNRTTKVVNGVTYTNFLSSTSNRQVTVNDVGGTFNVQYDAAGNVTSDGVNTYTYSDRGRMASATTAGGTVTYSYNSADQRVSKAGPVALVPTGAAYFVYDESGKVIGEYDANGAPIYETIYMGNSPVGVLKQTGTAAGNNIAVSIYNVYADHLGAPRVITRQADQAIAWRWDSAESYGGSAPNQNPSALGNFVYNARFPGQTFDAETGLFQNMRREYNPRIGRYMQSDPIGLKGGMNTYEYVGGAPTMFVDPRGEDRWGSNPLGGQWSKPTGYYAPGAYKPGDAKASLVAAGALAAVAVSFVPVSYGAAAASFGSVVGGTGVAIAAYQKTDGDLVKTGIGFATGAASGYFAGTKFVAKTLGEGLFGSTLAAQISFRVPLFTAAQFAANGEDDNGNWFSMSNAADAFTGGLLSASVMGTMTGRSLKSLGESGVISGATSLAGVTALPGQAGISELAGGILTTALANWTARGLNDVRLHLLTEAGYSIDSANGILETGADPENSSTWMNSYSSSFSDTAWH